MKSSRAVIIVLLALSGPGLWAELRAEFTSSHPDRWINPTIISRTSVNKNARHTRQSECAGFPDIVSSDFANSYWITPPSPAQPVVFVLNEIDPLEIIDFHFQVGACVNGQLDFSNLLVTATLRLYKDGELILEKQVQSRNCILSPDGPFGCATGWAALPNIGTYPIEATPPTISFAPDAGHGSAYRRIMNRAQPLGNGYPSPYQERLVGIPSVADVGGMIEIEVLLTGVDGSPAAGVNVYPRVIDPPDPAPYRSDRRKGDNRDTTVPFVSGAPGYEVQVPGSTDMVLRTDSAGKVYARLHGSTREAGDNYRLRVSLYRAVPDSEECSPNNMAARCFESEVFTVWKRAVIEKDHMLRAGTFIAQDYNGGTQMRVLTANTFRPAAGATLIFLHSGSGASSASSEIRSIVSYKNGVITLTQPLNGTYDGQEPGKPVHIADAVGILGSGFYDLDLGPLRTGLDAAFIDVQERPQTTPYFPYVDKTSEVLMRDLSERWREDQTTSHLIGARYSTRSAFGSQAEDFSYTWVQQCIDYTSAADPLRNEVAAHEVVHRWDVNIAAGRSTDHCDLNAYANSANRCTMHTYVQQTTQAGSPIRPEFRDGIVQFHYVVNGGSADSEYLGLRSKDGVQ